jgi:opacity protein-like surface antigen
MSRVKILALAGATALLGTAALAADLPPPLPPPVYPAPVAVESGWYLRGDVGVAWKRFENFEHHPTNPLFVWPASWRIDQKDMADAAFVGFGIGYSWANWLRFDVTAEYRMKEWFKVVGSYTEFCTGGGRCFDIYEGHHSNWLFLANAYLDLGTWCGITPFVGVGIGSAYHKITAFTDTGLITAASPGFGYAEHDHHKWQMAWALHAGLGYNVSSSFKVELAYRYLNFGSVDTSTIRCGAFGCDLPGGPRAYYTFTDFDSHDFKIGMRWMLQQAAPAYHPPLMRKG